MPVRNECVVAINQLLEATKDVRKHIPSRMQENLFVHQYQIGVKEREGTQNKSECCFGYITNTSYRQWLQAFCLRNGIRHSGGKPYDLNSHQFRRTLATDMLSKGTDINVIQSVLGHTSPKTTRRHYAAVKDPDRAKRFQSIGIIGKVDDVNSDIIHDTEELKWFRNNKDKGAAMCDGYCTKPFRNGEICERLLKRQKCYTCSRYITTPEYLDAHRSHLRSLEHQLQANAIYGKHYAEHFRPTIEVLKFIISRLEGLQDAG